MFAVCGILLYDMAQLRGIFELSSIIANKLQNIYIYFWLYFVQQIHGFNFSPFGFKTRDLSSVTSPTPLASRKAIVWHCECTQMIKMKANTSTHTTVRTPQGCSVWRHPWHDTAAAAVITDITTTCTFLIWKYFDKNILKVATSVQDECWYIVSFWCIRFGSEST